MVLDGLNASLHLFAELVLYDGIQFFRWNFDGLLGEFGDKRFPDVFSADVDERGQVRQRYRLAAVLARSHNCDYLRGDVARREERMRLLDLDTVDHRSVLEHVVEVPKVAVVHFLDEVIGIVEMYESLIMGFLNVFREEIPVRQITAGQSCDVVPLR